MWGNMTIYQQHLLRKIQSCHSEDELRQWLVTLPTNVLAECVSIIHALSLDILDERLDENGEDLTDVKLYLKKFML